jgi:hypothetical protein
MKKLLFALVVSVGLVSCSDQEPDLYTGNQLEFELFQSSTYDFKGNLEVKELRGGGLEFTLRMDGSKAYTDYSYPAHLHFGSYDQADAPIAHLLNPVSAKNLESVTVLGTLSDGSKLTFGQMKSFDGHVKIHLANDGPDYGVILVAGNVGGNFNPELGFDPSKIAVCGKSF